MHERSGINEFQPRVMVGGDGPEVESYDAREMLAMSLVCDGNFFDFFFFFVPDIYIKKFLKKIAAQAQGGRHQSGRGVWFRRFGRSGAFIVFLFGVIGIFFFFFGILVDQLVRAHGRRSGASASDRHPRIT